MTLYGQTGLNSACPEARKDFYNMCVCSESASCKACEAAKNGVCFSSMSILAASLTQQMVLYGQTLIVSFSEKETFMSYIRKETVP